MGKSGASAVRPRRGFDFSCLSKGFVLAKPKQWGAFDETRIYELEKENYLITTRKRNGYKLFALVTDTGEIKLFTSGIQEIDDGRLDHLKDELLKKKIPKCSLLVGEGVMVVDGTDDRGKVTSVIMGETEWAREVQNQHGKMKFIVFNIVFWAGEKAISRPYAANLLRIQKHFAEHQDNFVLPIEILKCTYDEAKKLVQKHGWEGLVLYDVGATSSFRLDGKSPKRPEGCYKWKPLFEDDFIVRHWLGYPEEPNMVKDLILRQRDLINGKEFDCGKFGTFDRKTRKKLAETVYPIVIQLEFEGRTSSGKLVNPRFMAFRTDKAIHECMASKQYPKAMYF